MSEYDVEINNVFSLEAINFMRKSIVDSYGNEVYLESILILSAY